MTLKTKQLIIGVLGTVFLISLVLVQWMEVARKSEEVGLTAAHVAIPVKSKECIDCHGKTSPGIIDHWKFSTHAAKGVGCVACHLAKKGDADGFDHYGAHIATIVTPKDCGTCRKKEAEEFANSHHAKGETFWIRSTTHWPRWSKDRAFPSAHTRPHPADPRSRKLTGWPARLSAACSVTARKSLCWIGREEKSPSTI